MDFGLVPTNPTQGEIAAGFRGFRPKTGNPIRCLALVVDLVVVVDVVVSLVFKLHRGDVLSCWTHLGIRLKGLEFEASSM